MKRRVRKIANFFAFNLLFFALYLNFIHKDKTNLPDVAAQQNAAFSGTVMVDASNANKNAASFVAQPANKEDENEVAALKLSIN
jgi:hypothetical protein